MFDLRDDGSIAIDFEIPPADDGGEPTPKQIIVKAPPTFGAYKRLRAEVDSVNKRWDELAQQVLADEALSTAEKTSQLNANREDSALEWWAFVINGDESFKGLGSEATPDLDSWPVYLTSNESISAALTHWKTVPLARGGKPVPTTP